MNDFKIFRLRKDNRFRFFILSDDHKCSVCGEEIAQDIAFYVHDWTKKGLFKSLVHPSCLEDFVPHPLSVIPEMNIGRFCRRSPAGSVLLSFSPPNVHASRGEGSSDYARLLSARAGVVTDRTVHANKGGFASLEGAVVGDPHAIERAAENDRELSDVEAVKLLEGFR